MVTTFRVLGALLAGMWAVHAAAGLIDIGLQKQLFLDDHLLERKTNAERVMYQGTRVSDGPLQLHDKPWEGNYNLVRSIHQDPETGDLVLFYRTTEFTSGDGFKDEATRLCIARSDDGVHWKRPNLGLVEFEGSTENNILPHDSVAYDLYDFIYDPTASDPAKRFKGMERVVVTDPEVVERRAKEPLYYRMEEKYVEMMRDRGGVNSIEWNLYYSPDGIRWEPYKDNPVMADPPQSRRWAGPTTLMWDPIRNLYAAHIESCQHARCPMFMRLIGRSESTNMVDWSYPETIIVPDDRDPEGTQFYCFAVGAYAGLYTGVLGTYYTQEGTIVPQFAFSRDGIRYDRRFREPFIPLGKEGAYDSLEIYPGRSFRFRDRIWMYYMGRPSGHGAGPEMRKDDIACGIGASTWRLDGFASLNATPGKMATVVTRAFSFKGDALYVNWAPSSEDADAELRVAVTGPAHHIIPGFTLDDSDVVQTGSTAHEVTWNGKGDLGSLEGKPVKLEFAYKNGELYSFQFK